MTKKSAMNKDILVEYYRQMRLIRSFEEESARQYMIGNIKGFLHLYIGQEAVAVGAIAALNSEDYIFTHYRDHGHALARGMSSKTIMAELFGKVTGSSKGKGGSMHLFDVKRGFMGGYAIVAGQIPLAVGVALAIKYKKESKVVLCFVGDGSLNEGEFHEAMNMVSIWQLPIVFLCENNLYGMGAPVKDTFAMHDSIYKFADGYKVKNVRVDGMDVLAVNKITEEAIKYARSGAGPYFIEAITYRFRGHSVADPSEYRKNSEVVDWEKRDPLSQYKLVLANEFGIKDEEIKNIDLEVEQEVEAAVEFADKSSFPSLDEIFQDIYGKEL